MNWSMNWPMSTYPVPVRRNPPANDELHPLVYRTIIGLTIWLVLSVWALFSRGAYEGLTLSVITFFWSWSEFRSFSGAPGNTTPILASNTTPLSRSVNGLLIHLQHGPAASMAAKPQPKSCCR